MKHMITAGCVATLMTALAACSGASPLAAQNQPAAGATGSYTAYLGAAPNVSPDDPAYSENGAPRAGQPAGTDTAGAPSPTGNYAPLQHQHTR